MSFAEPPFNVYLADRLTQAERDALNPVLLPETGEAPIAGLIFEQDPRVIVVKLLEIDRGVLTPVQRDIIHKAIDYFARQLPPDRALQRLEDGRNTSPSPNVIQIFLDTQPPFMRESLVTILGKARLAGGVERINFEVLLAMTDAHTVADYLEKVWEHGLNLAQKDLLQDLKIFVAAHLASLPASEAAAPPTGQGAPRPLHPLELPVGAKEFSVPYVGVIIHWITQDHEALAAHFLAKKKFVQAAQHLIAAAGKKFAARDFKTTANLAAQAYFLLAFVQDNVGEKADHPYLLIKAALLECQACLRTLQYERVEIILSDVKSRIESYKATNKKTDSIYDELARLEKLYTALKGCLNSVLESQSLRPEHYVALFRTLYDHPLGWMTRRAAHAMALAWRKGGLDTPESLFAGLSEVNPTLGVFYAFDARVAFYARDQEAMDSRVTGTERADLYDLLSHMQLASGHVGAAYDTLLKKISALLKAHRTVAAMGTGEAALKLTVDYADSADGKSPDFYQLVEIYQQALADQTLDASYKDNLVVFVSDLYDQWFDHLKEKGLNPIAVYVEQVQFLVAQNKMAMAEKVLTVKIAMQDSYINIDPTKTTGVPISFQDVFYWIEFRSNENVQFFVGHPQFLKGVLLCLALIYKNMGNNAPTPGSHYEKLAASLTDVEIPTRNTASNWHEEIKTGGVYNIDGRAHTLERVADEPDEAPVAISLLMTKGQRFLQDEKFQDAAIAFNQAYYLATQWKAELRVIVRAAGLEALAWLGAKIFEPALVATLDSLSHLSGDSVERQRLKATLTTTIPWRPENLLILNLLVNVSDAIKNEGTTPSHRAIIASCVLADAVLMQNALGELFQKLGEISREPQWLMDTLKSYEPLVQDLNIDPKYKKAFTRLSDLLAETREDPEPEPSGPGGGRRVEPLTLRVIPNRPTAAREKKPAGKRGEPDGGAAAILAGTRVITGGNPLLAATPPALEQGAIIFQAPEVITTVPDSTAQSSTTPDPVQPESNLAPPPIDDSFAPILHPGLLQPTRATLHRGGLRLVTGK